MSQQVYLGVDLGAESGRVMAGLWDGKKMQLEELHRFPNGGVTIADTLRWNTVGLWSEIQTGLTLAATDQLVLYTDARQAYLNGSFYPADVTSAWFVLEPGATQVYLDGSNFAGGATLSVAYSSAWL